MKIMKHQINLDSKKQKVAQNFFILIKNEREQINIDDIVYIEADINYSTFNMIDRKFTSSFHLGFFEKSLENNSDFLRINRNLIVNIQHLSQLNLFQPKPEIALLDGTLLPISRRRVEGVKARVIKH